MAVTRPRSEPQRTAQSWIVLATLSLCGTVVSLQQTILLPLLPELPRLLDTSTENASWLVTATLLTGAVATPVVSRLADLHGKRRLLTACLLVAAAGSVIGALGDSFAPTLCARALQGVGMAVIPVGIAAMRDELPEERVPLGVALMSATLAIGAGVGMPLAGILVEHLDWHAIFWVTAALGAVMAIPVALVLSPPAARPGGTFDYRGALVLSAGLTGLLLALSKGGQWGWTALPTVASAAGGLLLLPLWLLLQLRVRHPLVDVRTAARPAVLLVNIATVLVGFAMFVNLLITTQLLQQPTESGYGLGLDTTHTGLWMAPSALVFGVMAPVAAAVTKRFDARVTLVVGAAALAAAYVARVFLSHTLWQIILGSMLVGVGTSLTFAAMPTLIMAAVPQTETASANGLNTLLRSIGTSTASAATSALLAIGLHRVGNLLVPTFGSLTAVFWLAAAASALAVVIAVPLFRLGDTSRRDGTTALVVADVAGDAATALSATSSRARPSRRTGLDDERRTSAAVAP